MIRKMVVPVLSVWCVCFCGTAFGAEELGPRELRMREAEIVLRAYPDAGLQLAEKDDGVFIVSGGTEIFFSPLEGCPPLPHPDDLSGDAPLCASFGQRYPLGAGHREPALGFEPGRIRNETFLKALYGKNAAEVEKSLETVDFFGTKLRFSSRHGAAASLKRVTAKLEEAVKRDPALLAYILPSGGTYAWRKISKSPRLSAHSFGICIDLNIEKGIYWQWNPSRETIADARQNYPQIIVDAFETEGFIWGGKWYSFDYMHFEYRPELCGE